ncbi:hypothetical protein B0H11DRAFT_1906514 [Mycena galericulata]|nr:hypothetical protein B0H11DRAFT_1906514 [Mycena galericulata]
MTSTIPIAVLLKPRRSHPVYGTNWLPYGLSHGPFDPAYSPPAEATERHEITISQTFFDQWFQFKATIQPLFVIPQLESEPLRVLYADWQGRVSPHIDQILDFLRPVLDHIGELHLALGLANPDGLDLPEVCDTLFVTDLWSVEDKFMELKMAVNILHAATSYLSSMWEYEAELKSRCSAWDKFLGNSTLYLENIQSTLLRWPGSFDPPIKASSLSSSSTGSDKSDEVSAAPVPKRLNSGLVRRQDSPVREIGGLARGRIPAMRRRPRSRVLRGIPARHESSTTGGLYNDEGSVIRPR